MLIKDIFLKDIERDIRGVIKVAQTSEEDIYQELNEYVVTQELHKHFSKFYSNYLKGIHGNTDKMGVWTSGFFGSGKSHFLKILAYLLENQPVKGKKPVEFFEEKIKDPIVYANMQKAAEVETETILFNIDSKSAMDSKSKEDAILRVFMKVFYEHRGYYGDIAGVAEMEKYLDKQNVYESFKTEFEKLAGEPWESRRNTFYFDRDFVLEALTKATGMTEESAANWFDNGVDNFEISIESFSKDVKEYIDEKGPNFHLIFLVDEIGQYIGDSRSLMLNLQTLTEDLGAHAKGKVWIVVTAQESIDSIIKVKGDDFSRIQGRFDTRLSLSSISVDEVIKERLLAKHPYVNDKLRLIYHEKSAILKNLISFREHTADLRGYNDEKEFADVYPFIPYQFKLLQNVFEQVRRHGSSGKHLSEGERSMLSAFKEAGLKYKGEDEGTLVPFQAFYDTIKEFLHPSISRVIEGANENPALRDDSFNIDLLKVLFMIKYIKELPANIDNISTLMVSHIDEDKLELKEKINKSLRKLISQTLIQKNGEYYLFLTDEEQDINREIKQMNIDEDRVKRELGEYIYHDIYSDKQYKYDKNYSFSFNANMDEKNYGKQTSSIGIQIISPLSDHFHKSDQEMMMMSSDSGEMIIKLDNNDTYIEEIEETLRIEEYRKKRNISQLSENIQNILNNKQVEARERRYRVRDLLIDAIKLGNYFINGSKIDVKGSTVKEKINAGFQLLVENVYTKIGYVKEHLSDERELLNLLSLTEDQYTFDNKFEMHPNGLAKQEIYRFIEMQEQINVQSRVKLIYERFENKPYGWRQLDIAGLLTELLREQQIRIRYNSEDLVPEQDAKILLTLFTKANESEKAIILKREKIDVNLLRDARSITRDLFNISNLSDDEDGLVKDIRHLIEKKTNEINAFKVLYEGQKYPGLSLLNKGLEYFEQLDYRLDNKTFLTKLKTMADDLLDWEEDIVKVESFFGTSQRKIFDSGIYALEKYEDVKMYLSGDETRVEMNELQSIINDPVPYKKIKEIPELVDSLNESINSLLEDRKERARKIIKKDYNELISMYAQQYGVSEDTRESIKLYYEQLQARLEDFVDLVKVDALAGQSESFKNKKIKEINNEIDEWLERREREQKENKGNVKEEWLEKENRVIEKVNVQNIMGIRTLSSEEEVDSYVNMLSSKLKQIIKDNKQIEFMD